MLHKTEYQADTTLFKEATYILSKHDMRITINQPTGNFFYDPWVIKDEYKGTVWETLYNSLAVDKGEARILILDPNQCYQIHADIDDRYHLNILGENSYLIDLENEKMYPVEQDGIWYEMDAGRLHTATNFGRRARIQLVVRKLLSRNTLTNPVSIAITSTISNEHDARFLLDNTVSRWLNNANKLGVINEFSPGAITIKFNIENDKLDLLKQILPSGLAIV